MIEGAEPLPIVIARHKVPKQSPGMPGIATPSAGNDKEGGDMSLIIWRSTVA